jgi:hypothetical protein
MNDTADMDVSMSRPKLKTMNDTINADIRMLHMINLKHYY